MSRHGWTGRAVVLVCLVLAAACSGGASQNGQSAAAPNIAVPDVEKQFISVVAHSQAQSGSAANDMQRGGIKAERDKGICQVLNGSEAIEKWIGTVETVDSNSDGKGVLAIKLAEHITVTTWNNDISDTGDDTLIPPGTPLFAAASALEVGQTVVFSGHFFPGSDGDCIDEQSLTLEGKIGAPEFTVRFESVSTSLPTEADAQGSHVANEAKSTAPPAAGSAASQEPSDTTSEDQATAHPTDEAAPLAAAAAAAEQTAPSDTTSEDQATAHPTDEAAPLPAAAPPAEQTASVKGPSFDCAKASTSAEKAICANPDLAQTDSDMAVFYKKNLDAAAAGVGASAVADIKNGQREFIKKRNQCADDPCVKEAYRARWEELAQLGFVRE